MAGRDLACVVMSCGNEPGLVSAVRSVLEQDVPLEVVVVNSAGGDAAGTLAEAGLDVPVWECEERLNPGAARNRGIAMTSAPFVSFLAADCVAEPGWARERLALHRAGEAAVASAMTNATRQSAAAEASFLLLFHTRVPHAPESERLAFGGSYARSLFDANGPFREDLRTGEDSDFNERIAPTQLAWSSRVRTAHAHPGGVPAMMAEQFGRGRRMAAARTQWRGVPLHTFVARRAAGNARAAMRAALRSPEMAPGARLRVAALIPPAAAAYAAGALSARPRSRLGDPVRRLFADAAVPSAGPSCRGRRPRLLAVLAVRDELEELPGCLASLAPEVDGIVALDDGSTDGSADWLEARPEVLEVIRVPPDRERWEEMENHRRLVEAAIRHGADWIVAVDADERLEPGFRARAERVIARGRWLGFDAFAVRVRELWGSSDTYRTDGVWGRKAVARLFRARADHRFDDGLHARKGPLQVYERFGYFPIADLELHHRGVLTPERRAERRARYEQLDPDARWQPREGYAYLTDEAELELRTVALDRGWARWLGELRLAAERRRGRAEVG